MTDTAVHLCEHVLPALPIRQWVCSLPWRLRFLCAGLVVDGHDRQRLERICGYVGRPPIARERLERLDDGRLRFTMKKPWRDGTMALVFEPLDLVARVCAMIPPPGLHLVRYHGLFAPGAKLRAEVVPAPSSGAEPKTATGPQLELDLWGPTTTSAPRRNPWAWLLRHVFAEDLAACERRGGPTRWLEVATTPEHIASLLASLATGSGHPRDRHLAPLTAHAEGSSSSASLDRAPVRARRPASVAPGSDAHRSVRGPLPCTPDPSVHANSVHPAPSGPPQAAPSLPAHRCARARQALLRSPRPSAAAPSPCYSS